MSTFDSVFWNIKHHGKLISPRGQKTLEILNATYIFEPYERFANYPSRKLSLNYIKDELQWYLKGDPTDLSICEKAKIWQAMVTDGRLNSNYGHMVFRQKLLDFVVTALQFDEGSRRAMITILGKDHLYHGNNDVPCTVSLGFRLRDEKLLCTAHMRSTDAVYGLGNDIPFFSFVQECVLTYLNADAPDRYELGPLTLFSESLHVYERHFEMLDKLLAEQTSHLYCPRLKHTAEVDSLRAGNYDMTSPYDFTQWLLARDAKREVKP